MLFKKIAIAAAVATTLAFVGCAKKTEEAPAAEAASEAVEAASEVAVDAAAAASEATVAASEAIDAASEVAASEAK